MSIQTQPVQLNATPSAEERLVKRCATGLFRFIREAATYAEEIPGALQQAAADICDAWEETSRPKS